MTEQTKKADNWEIDWDRVMDATPYLKNWGGVSLNIPKQSKMTSYIQKPLMESIVISTQIRIQQHEDYWYTAEDTHLDVGCEGFTVSYWECDKEKGEKRFQHICMGKEEALAIADAIYKLFKN